MVVEDIRTGLKGRKHSASLAQFQRGTVIPLPALHTSAIGEGPAAVWWDAKLEFPFPSTHGFLC